MTETPWLVVSFRGLGPHESCEAEEPKIVVYLTPLVGSQDFLGMTRPISAQKLGERRTVGMKKGPISVEITLRSADSTVST